MPLRIAEYVLSGELRNTRRNSVFGWIEFAPGYGIRLELTGNFTGPLAGKHIRFHMPHRPPENNLEPGDFPAVVEELADRQIGVVQSMELRTLKVPQLPIDEFLSLSESERDANLLEKPALWLEWSSQDGSVLCELIEPELIYVEEEDAEPDVSNYETVEDGNFGLDLNESSDEEVAEAPPFGDDASLDEEDEDDPYHLFDDDLQANVSEALGNDPLGENLGALGETPISEDRTERSWDEVIPGIDPETRAMYERWDEIFEGKKDEPISYLFPKPLKLPKPEHVTTEEEAEELVKSILAQLALLSVALDVCEHFTPRQTYRLLLQEILPTAKVHPNLAASEMVQHYATCDYCQQCDAEFDAEYEARKREDEDDND